MVVEPRSCTKDLRPPVYPPATGEMLRMDANTNLYGANPVVERVLAAGGARDLNQYPSGTSDALRSAIAREFEVAPEEVIVGCGSDEVLETIAKAFLDPGDVVATPSPSFVMYAFYGRIHLGTVVEVPLREGFALDVDALLSTRAKITFVATPNNPTGNAFDASGIDRLVKQARGLVVIDEAYGAFCGQEYARTLRRDNVIVVRTFSKSHGLAGLRVGFGIGPRGVIDRLMAVKTPFTVGTMTERIAIAALADGAYVEESRRMILTEKPWLTERLRSLGLGPRPTDANFMLVDVGRPARPLVEALRKRDILVRDMSDFRGLANHFRVTIGRREHNERLVEALRAELGR
ncbi:MAG: histidinol-phosphate transaminase [Planctomycetes bacterium]|nr:histidinol-phosphate transaminase [Planctomycetota bacterium]